MPTSSLRGRSKLRQRSIPPAPVRLTAFYPARYLEVASDQATNSQIDFLSAGQLTIDNAALFGVNVGTTTYSGPLIEGFAAGDIIDIAMALSPTAARNCFTVPRMECCRLQMVRSQVATAWIFKIQHFGDGNVQFPPPDGSSGLKITHS